MAAATGVVLTAVGCGKGGALCTAGLINLPVGAAVTAGGVWMTSTALQINVTSAGQAPSLPLRREARRPERRSPRDARYINGAIWLGEA